ncbi:hypothetical protein ES319_A06G098100v1 [Gossypium barbadense]|uniref:Uncharacterized protein n=2 Tax=Gossypium TaxID=3633 RepID=A0A5J5VCG7_GOSBA|nr:hypothetical protein ES319_A06G098100v1 [Gossypium barbadense]TYH12992.1 hypothetical protein ES288_A06G109800v1 [Gossypium darwinii]
MKNHRTVMVVDSDEDKGKFHHTGPSRKILNSQIKGRIKGMKEITKKCVKIRKKKTGIEKVKIEVVDPVEYWI